MTTTEIDIWIPFRSHTISESKIALVHQCNCFCSMGAGIARQVRDNYPAAYEADLKTTHGDRSKMGTFSYAEVAPNRYICNLYSQYDVGTDSRKTNYEAVYSGLEKIKTWVLQNNINYLLIPYGIGCGLGGGDWNIIYSMLSSLFTGNKPNVIICKL